MNDKSGNAKRDKNLVKAAVEMMKNSKKDNSSNQKDAARKLYKASGIGIN